MAFPGGIHKVIDAVLTKDPRDPNGRRYYDTIIWGQVVDEPHFIGNKRGGGYYEFLLRWRKKTFCSVYCTQKNPFTFEMARLLHKGDIVQITGKMNEYKYERKNKKKAERYGEEGMYQGIEAVMMLPARLLLRCMELLASGDSDTVEGLEEYLKYAESEEEPEYDIPVKKEKK